MRRWRLVNHVLLGLIIIVNGYVILAPLWPMVVYDWQKHRGEQTTLERQLHPAHSGVSASSSSVETNHVVIPSMLLDSAIYEGPVWRQYQVLDKGIWRWPSGSTPADGGNTVLIGHRFTYTDPKGIFYYLNKVKVGDEIGVWWDNSKYLYKVNTISVVAPSDTAIEAPTADNRLTLFTCTPLWWPKSRLVVVASLETKT